MTAAAWLFGGLALVLVWGHLTTAAQLWTAEKDQRAARARLKLSVRRWRALRDGQAQGSTESRWAVTVPRRMLVRQALRARRQPLRAPHLREAR